MVVRFSVVRLVAQVFDISVHQGGVKRPGLKPLPPCPSRHYLGWSCLTDTSCSSSEVANAEAAAAAGAARACATGSATPRPVSVRDSLTKLRMGLSSPKPVRLRARTPLPPQAPPVIAPPGRHCRPGSPEQPPGRLAARAAATAAARAAPPLLTPCRRRRRRRRRVRLQCPACRRTDR